MQLVLRVAASDEFDFAWPMYRDFIVDKIFPISGTSSSTDDWTKDEESKFAAQWSSGEKYIIEVDGEKVGWAAVRKSNNSLEVENVFIVEDWQEKGLAEKIFLELIPTWKAEGRVVRVPLLDQDSVSKGIEAALTREGFVPQENDGISQVMVANWSK